MHSSDSKHCRLRSKSCYSNSSRRRQSCPSCHRTFVDTCDVRSSDSCTRVGSTGNHTVEIYEESVVNIDLPPLMWFGYDKTPKILSATNTGRTVLINGQWACGRPYITGGPLNGSYIFSQIHFHSPSEHEIDGRRYPLEMHVVHYKNSYLTQERAMKEKDGTIVLVYLFQLIESGATIVSQVSKLASCLETKNARRELCKFPLDQFVKPFNSNYYTYRSSVPTDKNSYLLQWIISCNNLYVTRQEVEQLLFIMSSSDSIDHLTMHPEDGVVFHVGEEDYSEWISSSQMTENPCCHHESYEVKSKTSVCEKPSKKSVCKKSSKKSACEKPSKKSVCKKSSKKSACEKPSEKSVCEKSSEKSVCEKPSEKSICEEPSKTSACEKASETSCASVKEKKTKKRDKSKSMKVDNATNTTPSCSKSDFKEKKQKEKKPKDVRVISKQSKSKSVEKCSSRDGVSQVSVKNATSSTSKEKVGKKTSMKKSTESKVSKSKAKKSSEDVKEKCAETHASKSTEKLDCSEANVKMARKSSEKIKTLYKKKQKGKVDPPPQEKRAVETKFECVQPPEFPCNTECSNTTENIKCTSIDNNIESNDGMCEDVQINYLFIPDTSSSVHSNVGKVESDAADLKIKENLKGRRNTIESKDFVKLSSEPIVNHALVKAVKFPIVKSGQSKHLYLHTKHIFRTEGDNREFFPHTFQECHMLIERDHNVLQEYNGTLYPNQLSPGVYEQVNLLSLYPDPEDLNLHATECIAKLESLHELSIRAKFLISETNFNGQISETLSTHKKSEDSIQKTKSFFDAQCQCEQPGSTSIAIDTNFLQEEINSPCKSLIKRDLRNMGLESLDFKNTKIVNLQNLNLWVGDEVDSRTRNEDKNLRKALVEQNGAIKLLKNPNPSGPELEITSKKLLEHKNEREDSKVVDDKSSIKILKNSSGKCKKTTYFVYDRIEKDEGTGKKIFVGSFRTRDEIEVLFKRTSQGSLSWSRLQTDSISSDLSDTQSNNPSLINESEIQENVSDKFIGVEDSQAVNKESTSKDESKQLEVITLHKFEPNHFHLRSARNNSKNLIIGKISSKVEPDSEKYSQLAEILGIDKTRDPKISFYEFQATDARNVNNISEENNCKFDVKKAVENSEGIDKDKVFPSTSRESDSLDGEYSEGLEGTSSLEKRLKSSDRKDSQAAVVVLPIKVDSLSKVEIVLIEHTDDVKKQKVGNKYTPYLKRYKRLILKLKFSFLFS